MLPINLQLLSWTSSTQLTQLSQIKDCLSQGLIIIYIYIYTWILTRYIGSLIHYAVQVFCITEVGLLLKENHSINLGKAI